MLTTHFMEEADILVIFVQKKYLQIANAWEKLLVIIVDNVSSLCHYHILSQGDRIAVMANGQLQCCGTPLYLKKYFGTPNIFLLLISSRYFLFSFLA